MNKLNPSTLMSKFLLILEVPTQKSPSFSMNTLFMFPSKVILLYYIHTL